MRALSICGHRVFASRDPFSVCVVAFSLGVLFTLGVAVLAFVAPHPATHPALFVGAAYAVLLAVFHTSEFLLTVHFSPHSASTDSFLLNQSNAFVAAMFASVCEWLVTGVFIGMHRPALIVALGACMSIGGLVLRMAARIQAGVAFTHEIAVQRRDEHKLVTRGVYTWSRHPGYAGFFWYAVGSQLMLCNVVCTLGFVLACWRFFADRIPYEEDTLVDFFGDDYVEYRKRVRTLIPFIA